MDKLHVGLYLDIQDVVHWMRKYDYLVVISSVTRAFTFGRPGHPAVIAPVPCTLVWDGTEVYLEGTEGALVRA